MTSIIMLTYNAPVYVENTINTLAGTEGDYELIVLDNHSQSETKAVLNHLYEQGKIDHLVFLNYNSLFSRGNNLASKLCSKKSDKILLLNSDIDIRNKKWLQYLLSVHERGAVSFGVVETGPWIRCDGYCFLIDRDLYDKYMLDEEFEWWWSVTKLQAQLLNDRYKVKGVKDHSNFMLHYGKMSGEGWKNSKGMEIEGEKVKQWFHDHKIEVIERLECEPGLYRANEESEANKMYRNLRKERSGKPLQTDQAGLGQEYRKPQQVSRVILERRIQSLEQALSETQQEVLNQKQQITAYTEAIQVYENSTSWKLTKPLRTIMDSVRGMKQKVPRGKRIYLMGTEDFGNIGDHHIALSELAFLRDYFPGYKVIEIPASKYFQMKPQFQSEISTADIIIGHGGGNLGNQYPLAEQIRRDFIAEYPENRIIIFPQTIYFTKDADGENQCGITKEIYNQHQHLTIVLREAASYEFAKSIFSCQVELVPDIVLYSLYEHNEARQNRALLCFRGDIEKVTSDDEIKKIEDIVDQHYQSHCYLDTQKDYYIGKDTREKEVQDYVEAIQHSAVVITDRLHGMVLAAITGTPCIAFNNYNKKVEGVYEFISHLPYVYMVDDLSEFEIYLNKVSAAECNFNGRDELESKYKKLAVIVSGIDIK